MESIMANDCSRLVGDIGPLGVISGIHYADSFASA